MFLYVVQAVMYMLAVLCIAGTAGNALVLCVFTSRKDSLVSTIYIISLAVVDFVTCLVVIPFTIYMEYFNFCISSDAVCKVRDKSVTVSAKVLEVSGHASRQTTVAHSLVVSRILYSLPSWGGFLSAELIGKVDAFLRRLKRFVRYIQH